MPHIIKTCALVGLIAGSTAFAQNLSSQDRAFMAEAAKGNMMEVQGGHIAADKGNSQAVKNFGNRMVSDHGKANDDLMALAKRKNVSLPAGDPNAINSESWTKKTGNDFDKAYAKDMVEDHKKDIAAFEKEAKSGSDPDVKSWAQATLPTLRSHLTDAEKLPK